MKALIAIGLLLAACGPTSIPGGDGGDDDGGDDQPPPPEGSISGTVWAPGNALGMVPAGYEIPVAGALVYVADSAPAAIPDGVYCDPCQAHPGLYAVTDAEGQFVLEDVASGPQRVVIEKAQFRLETMVDVPEGTGLAMTTAQTTLPSIHDPEHGKSIPRVAIAIGDSDQIEDIFAKMGILDVDSSGRALESSFAGNDRVELWGNFDAPFPAAQRGSIADLFGDLETMSRYHIIFVPCNYESDVGALAQPAVRANIAAYVAAGGKLYVTDWSAEWEDAAFPAFIEFDASTDTTVAMAAANSINLGDGDFGHFAEHARAVDPALNAWLDGQTAPLVIPAGGEEEDFPSTYAEGVIDASDFVIEGNWSLIRSLPTVQIGVDDRGAPVTTSAKTWITGDFQAAEYPHTVTFEPSCGRVLYSTYHTAQKTHPYLVPQERVLLYLIMEIGVCNDGPIIN